MEARIAPTTDLILDFDGGSVQSGQGYLFPSGYGTTFTGFTDFAETNPSGPGDRTEQILQIVSGVRQDFADFNVRVIWDDRGVASPFFDATDTVVMTVGEDGGAGLFGIANGTDLTQTDREVAFAFEPAHLDLSPDTAYRSIRELIDTISHEAGHTFGLAHAIQADSQRRQITTTAPQDTRLDSRFSTERLNHGSPDAGAVYAEHDRLVQRLGFSLVNTTRAGNEAHTNQTLPADTPLTNVNGTTPIILSGAIEHGGDRDAFRLVFQSAGTFVIRQRATMPAVVPVFTLWDAEGDFLDVASTGTAGGVSEYTFTATAGQTLYIVAGSALDRLESGETGTRTLGNYVVEVTQDGIPGPIPTGSFILAGADAGGAPRVRGIDPASGQAVFEFDAFGRTFRGGVRVARGDVNADGTPDIIAAAGPGGGPHVKVFDGRTFQLLPGAIGSFFAYSPVFNGGVFVAAADVNADGFADVITGPGQGGGPHVRVLSGADGSVLSEFYAYSPNFLGGVRVAGGDVNGDGLADVITGAGPGGGPHVRAFSSGTGAVLGEFFAYPANFGGGVFVSAGDVNGDGIAEVITGTGPGGGPIVRVFNGLTGEAVTDFAAYPSSFTSPAFTGDARANFGVRVTALDLNGDGSSEIIATPGAGTTPRGRVFDGDGTPQSDFLAFDPFFLGGVFVG